ncbi:translation elongation factor 4 [Patescibacteria group bacterium]|nr:translation elongation factor 4 [Patescibacteria group bacterium]
MGVLEYSMKNNLKNFCIIAHIDHGKSTLADRFLELTKTIDQRKMKDQLLDQMDLERERGITIKLQPVRMQYNSYTLNLIDTPGHVDFTYEVSRSLSAVEGAVLLVDATQGVQAQTLANLYLAIDQNLEIIPVINKIDLPNADIKKTKEEICNILDCKEEDIIAISAKTGENIEKVLDRVIKVVPSPQIKDEIFTSLIFDSVFDEYKGVIAYIRVKSGTVKPGDKVKLFSTNKLTEVLEVGYFIPSLNKSSILKSGEIGYIVTGLKEVSECKVGDTICSKDVKEALPGFKEATPFVFAGFFCKEGNEYPQLREAMSKLKLNDAALVFEPENSKALGFGFRCGFLGLLHLEIIQQRLKREYNLDLVVTVPSVAYKVIRQNTKEEITIHSPLDLPDPSQIDKVLEPTMKVDIFAPKEYLGGIMKLAAEKRGEYLNTEYIDDRMCILHYHLPLTSIIIDFYDQLKSVSSGYASLNYEFLEYRSADIIRLDILVAEEKVEAFSTLVYKDSAFKDGKKIVQRLKESIPKQMFIIKLQAAIGGKVIAAERISALRKDVTAKLYGGDYSRKQKLLSKQKKGKKKMQSHGSVDIPTEAYLKVLKK